MRHVGLASLCVAVAASGLVLFQACGKSKTQPPASTSSGGSGSSGTAGTGGSSGTSGSACRAGEIILCGEQGSSCAQVCQPDETFGPCQPLSGPTDFQTDPKNCGSCGHACAKPLCTAGICGCSLDADCAPGERCNETGLCVSSTDPCATVRCASGQVCRGGACQVAPCTGDGGCEAGEVCDSSGVCRWPADPCANVNCASGSVCRAGACQVRPCSPGGGQCGAGELCGLDGVCHVDRTDPCANASCTGYTVCRDGGCQVANCTGDGGCQPDESCANGTCLLSTNACSSVACAFGEVCQGGTCQPVQCSGDGGCAPGETCGGGLCRPPNDPCAGLNCPSGQVCRAGSCAAVPCTASTDCASGESCESGVCVLPQDPCSGVSCTAGYVCHAGTCQSGCYLGGTFYTALASNPANACQSCQPAVSTNNWSNVVDGSGCGTGQLCHAGACQGGCLINDAFVAPNALDPSNACQSCQPSVSQSAWTPLADGTGCGSGQVCSANACRAGCSLGGAFVAPDALDASNACQSCQPSSSTSSWTLLPASAVCRPAANACDVAERCTGSSPACPADQPATDGTACGSGQICTGGVCQAGCYIGSAYYAPNAPNSSNVCQSCQPTGQGGTTSWSNVTDGTDCGGGKYCSGGSCACPGGGTATASPSAVCPNGTSTLSLNGAVGTIQWQSSTDDVNWSDIPSATSATYATGPLPSSTFFRAKSTSGSCPAADSSTALVAILSSVGGNASASPSTICSGSPSTLTLSGYAGSIQWQSSTDGTNWTLIAGATSATYAAPALSQTTYYQAVVTDGSCTSATSSMAAVTVVQPSVGGTASASPAAACTGSTSTLTLSGYTGTLQWQSSPDGTNWTNISGATSASYTTPALSQTTHYQAVVTDGVCPSATSTQATVTVDSQAMGGFASVAPSNVCPGSTATVTLSNDVGAIQWQTSYDGSSWSDIPGATASTYSAPTFDGSHTYVYYRAHLTNGACSAYSTTTNVTVQPAAVSGTATGTQPGGANSTTRVNLLSGETSALTLAGNTGNIQWQSSTDGTSFADLSGQTLTTYTTPGLTGTIYYRAKVTNGICQAISNVVQAAVLTNQVSFASSNPGWQVPAGVTQMIIKAYGGGGGGGNCSICGSSPSCQCDAHGGAGGGGGYGRGVYSVSAGSSYAITIGTGGAGGPALDAYVVNECYSGSPGSASSFGSLISSSGGGGGGAGNDSYACTNGAPGTPGTSSAPINVGGGANNGGGGGVYCAVGRNGAGGNGGAGSVIVYY